MYGKVMKALIVNALSAFSDVDALMIKRSRMLSGLFSKKVTVQIHALKTDEEIIPDPSGQEGSVVVDKGAVTSDTTQTRETQSEEAKEVRVTHEAPKSFLKRKKKMDSKTIMKHEIFAYNSKENETGEGLGLNHVEKKTKKIKKATALRKQNQLVVEVTQQMRNPTDAIVNEEISVLQPEGGERDGGDSE